MRYVGYDQLRNAMRVPGSRPRRSSAIQIAILMFLSVALLLLSRLDHSYISGLRWHVTELMTPVLKAAIVPLEPVREAGRQVGQAFGLAGELERLRNENQQLKGWEWRARELERKFAELTQVAKTAREVGIEFITARVIANSSGAFVRSVIINAGRQTSVKPGYPVLSGDGLVGRIVETGQNASRVMLLTDAQSRIPVHVGRAGVRAILAGDNGPQPRLVFLPPDRQIAVGDEISTSGVGGLFPRGLRIGVVASAGAATEVTPHADLDSIEYLSVLLHETPELEVIGATGGGGSSEAALSSKLPNASSR